VVHPREHEDVVTAVEDQVNLHPQALARPRARDVLAAYVGLTKPRIIELLLLTTVPVMFLAERGVPDVWLVVATVVGGTPPAARIMVGTVVTSSSSMIRGFVRAT